MVKVQLGGNISIEGFEGMEPAKVIVAKKMIGLFAKKTGVAMGSLDAFDVKLSGDSITIHAKAGARVLEEKAEDKNVFVALSNALSAIIEKAK
ncbi:MAG: hypothetical protein KJ955_03595 [Nanoarchaeota archaeon]|nr:hypothetical protein [Nanoarchaeota archaeon]